MLSGSHGSSVDVHIRIDLDSRDLKSCCFQQETRGRRWTRWIGFNYRNIVVYVWVSAPITPLPMPLTTPPDTRMYFVMAAGGLGWRGCGSAAKQDDGYVFIMIIFSVAVQSEELVSTPTTDFRFATLPAQDQKGSADTTKLRVAGGRNEPLRFLA